MNGESTDNRNEELMKVFEDFQHQIKGPITQAHVRAQRASTAELSAAQLVQEIQSIRGLCGKARQIATRIGLFVGLSRGQKIPLNLSQLEADDLIEMLKETADDNQLMIEPSRQISYRINIESFRSLATCSPRVDRDLLEQAIRSILDNAGKYSYSNSVIGISGGLTKSGEFYISITNQGIPILEEDLNKCAMRGWRSEEAMATTGEGSGLGLWIVDNIMKAQGGKLSISPSSADGITDLRLLIACREDAQ